MAIAASSSVFRSVNFLSSKRSVAPETSFMEASSSKNYVIDGPVRVKCAAQGFRQRIHPSESEDSSTEEWWRKPPSQNARVSHETRGFALSSDSFDEVLAERQLVEESTWIEHPFEETPTSRGTSGSVPVFVMLPLDSVNMASNTVHRRRAMAASLRALKSAGVHGIMMDVWWGIVEKDGPEQYNWSAYRDLIQMAQTEGLKVQAVMSFHQCGGNVGDSCSIPLPPWVVEEINSNNDLVYTDKYGNRNYEYLSLGVDELPVLKGRSPVQVYSDFMRSFRDNFSDLMGETVIEIQVGMGPAGELRYPGYPEQNGRWKFPGVGEFQCYDKYMLANLKAHADSVGKASWGMGGPSDAGNYNQRPNDTPFFKSDGGWNSAYGKFFLEWYSEMLLSHGERLLAAAAGIFRGSGAVLSGKVAGIHWHYGTRSHAPELTAGYFNTRGRDGYLPVARMFGKHGVTLNFTCIEMKDEEQPADALCSPEKLLKQVAYVSRVAGVSLAGENALPRFDQTAFDQVVRKSRLHLDNTKELNFEPMTAFTFLRMCENLFYAENWRLFVAFVRHMQEGRTFQPWEREHQETQSRVNASETLMQHASEALMYR